MKNNSTIITRRTFIKQGTSAALAAGMYFNTSLAALSPGENSKVVLIRRDDLTNDKNRLQLQVVEEMIDEALCTLLNISEPANAWRNIISEKDIVGIKTNEGTPATPPEIEAVVKSRIIQAGIPTKNISINDRGVRNDSIFQNATALINMRPMKTHHWSGVGTLLKNYIMFVPQPWMYHDDGCADLGAIWLLPQVKGKTRLNILVMIQPLFHGIGPHHYSPKYTWKYNGLIIGQDAVAVDSVGLRIILAKRKSYFKDEKPLIPLPKHIQYAQTRHGVGIADMDRIDLIQLGNKKGSLI
jgi:hypothetical protein